MAQMLPSKPKDFHGSTGEERVFHALRGLPEDVVIIHSFRWIHPGNARALTKNLKAQGEGDFVLFDPSRGVIVFEVKGGDVWCDQGEWRQRNRKTGEVNTIDPEAQASDTMHRIREDIVRRVPESKALLFCHAVWFPEVAVNRAVLPFNYHADTTLDADDIPQVESAIRRAFKYWRELFPQRRGVAPDVAARIVDAMAPTLSFVRSVRQTVDEREEQFVRLTREQVRIIDFLDEQPHAAIVGAAGTGKTLVALEKARRLASPAEPVLFLCYNRALRDYLDANHPHANVRYLTFHGLAGELIGLDGTHDEVAVALVEHLANDGALPYVHLVVDEAQDFEQDWLEYLRYRFRDSTFYVFYDRYQAIQGDRDSRWLDDIPCRLVLTRNCRNTDAIALVAYRAIGINASPTLGLAGPRPVLHRVSSSAQAVSVAEHLIRAACERYKTPPDQIAVLTLGAMSSGGSWSAPRLGGERTSETPTPNRVTVTTVRRFKGLEARLVIIVDVDFRRAVDEEWRRALYVACSRARQAVHILTPTDETELGAPLKALAGTDKVRPSWRAMQRHLGVRLGGEQDDPFEEPGPGRVRPDSNP